MRHIVARLIVALGLQLVAVGRWLASDDPPGPGQRRQAGPQARKAIDLPRREYRILNAPPGRWEVIRLGLAILIRSVAFATVGV